jgi:hypothetical protein
MNSARLREIVDLLLAVESQFEIQNRLNEASSQLSNIVQQPQQVAFQTQFSDSVGQLRDISTQLRGRLQPAQIELIGAFSELATGTVEKIQVHQISTSDPQFFFGMNPVTIASIGGAITWALNTWKQVADVRRVRAS